MAGSRNERYLDETKIGSGSFGMVYLVKDTKDNSKFVLVIREGNSFIKTNSLMTSGKQLNE